MALSPKAKPPDFLRQEHAREKERLYTLLDREAAFAFTESGLVSHWLELDQQLIHLRFAGATLAKSIIPALAHLKCEPAGRTPDLTIEFWENSQSGEAFPMPRWPSEYFTARGEIMGLDSADFRVAYFAWLKLLNAYYPKKHRAFYCLDKAEPFALQQAGSPALNIFNWWSENRGLQMLHGAVIGLDQGAVLIAGHGGAGKSTLAFSTLDKDLRYLADDYFLLAGPPARAVSLYSSGKVTNESRGLLKTLNSRKAAAYDPVCEKSLYYLHEQAPASLLGQAALRAVVLPNLCSTEVRLDPINPRVVYDVLATSTMKQLAGTHYPSFLRIRRLLDGLPFYRLDHGRDMDAALKLLRNLCGS
jgi:hypothetical protein